MTTALLALPTTAPFSGDKIFTWKDVAAHNTLSDAWVAIDGVVYDVTDMAESHPGGSEIIAIIAGREASELFRSYHPFAAQLKHAQLWLEKEMHGVRRLGVLDADAMEFPAFLSDEEAGGFFKEACEVVDEYFKRTGLDSKNPAGGLKRMVPVALAAATTFSIMNGWLDLAWPLRVLAAIVFGVCQVLPLLHVMHDSSHLAIGHHQGWWKTLGRASLDFFAGGSMLSWQHQHTIGHHIHTNFFQADPDVPDHGEVRRVTKPQKWASVYRWQWLYLPLAYSLLTMKVRVDDIVYIWWQRMNGPLRVNYFDSAWLRIVASKGFWVSWRLLFPLLVLQVPASTFWTLFLIGELASGFWLAWNFQVSHISQETVFPSDLKSLDDGRSPLSWAETQVITGVDYAPGNALVTFFAGALNYQITHHLFPCVSQYHYPAITPLIKAVAQKHGLPWRVEPTYAAAWKAHVNHLYDMGQQGTYVPLELE